MKRLSIVLLLVTLLLDAAWAQRLVQPNKLNNAKIYPISNARGFNSNLMQSSGSRATQPILLDYSEADAAYAQDNGFDFYFLFWEINNRQNSAPPQDTSGNFTCDWASVRFDSLYDVIEQVGYPYAGADLTVDTIGMYINHQNTTGNPDTLTISILERAANAIGITSGNNGLTLTNTVLWDTMIITTTALTPGVPVDQADFVSIPCGYTLPTGTKFLIKVDFAGDTANKFQLADFCRSDCGPPDGQTIFASTSIFPENSWRWLNLFFPASGGNPANDLSGVGGLIIPSGDSLCYQYFFQNWGVSALLTANIPLNLNAPTTSLSGCPGAQVALEAQAVGGTAPYNYNWSNGSQGVDLTSVQVLVGSSTQTYSVTVTDGDNNTVTATFTVTPQGVTVALGNDTLVGCGQTISILPNVGGNLSGATYTWNNGATTLSLTNVGAGTYSVTVANSSGCSATDNINVGIGSTDQTLNFNLPSTLIRNCPFYIQNQSTRTTGWNFEWGFGDSGLSFDVSPCHEWTALGSFTVTMTADSAGCQLVKTDVVQIIQGTCVPSDSCVSGIAEDLLNSLISIYPNPNSGVFTVDMTDVKAENAVINVVNMQGQTVFAHTFSKLNADVKKNIDLSDAATGIYLVNIQVDGTKVSRQIHISRQ
jgi:hypothetical protein